MKVLDSWLREWLPTELPASRLADELTRLGLEVEGVAPVGPELAQVVVGEVLAVQPHPNADRLRLCEVNAGAPEAVRVVCGAANVRQGGRYPLALPGARLPGGLEIAVSTIRGEASAGMLCSAVELGLADTADGLLELGEQALPGEPVTRSLGLDGTVIDVNLTPNRADCFSVLGLARDLAAGLGLPLNLPRVLPVLAVHEEQFPVSVAAPAACPRFAGRVIRDLDPDAESPAWLQQRLQAAGVRPISPVVDVTNYVMLEYGQPMHAYDLERLQGGIEVREARGGDRLTLLTGDTVEPAPGTLLITDASGPIGLAGIMGGEATAVSDATRHVFLESAFFAPAALAGRARALGLHTDASQRFERGVDPAHQERAIERATSLLLELAGGCPGPVDVVAAPAHVPRRAPVRLRRERLAALLGVSLPDAEVAELLRRLDLRVTALADGWEVQPPTARFDLNVEVDLVEEVARLYGYDRIPEAAGLAPVTLGQVPEAAVPLERAALSLVERGYQEAITYSFTDAGLDAAFAGGQPGAALSNPISASLAVMRQSLWPGLAQALGHNLSRQHPRVRLFETGVRFRMQGDEIKEENVIAGLLYGHRWPEQWGAPAVPVDVFDIKADLAALVQLSGAGEEFAWQPGEHPALRPGRTVELRRGDAHVGWLGELHPALVARLDLAAAPVLFEVLAAPLLAARRPVYQGLSRYPAVRRDLAVVVPAGLAAGTLEAAVRRSAGDLLRELILFDVYTGEKVETGSKSVALGLILQDTSRTLTDADVDQVMRDVTLCLSRECNATIRE